jgi:UDP-3-O-[3-hydroxymyristoyl] glucosamine N-acyltransferase
VLKLSDVAPSENIVRDGEFSSIGATTAKHAEGILCYASTYDQLLRANRNDYVSCIITAPSLSTYADPAKGLLVARHPDILYGDIVNPLITEGLFRPNMRYERRRSAKIHPSSHIGRYCYIGENVHIGRNCIIHDYTVLEDNVIIGDNVILGCEGFYFKRLPDGRLKKFLHAGGVYIEKNVEIMHGSMIQRAHDPTFTRIGEGTKISVNVNIGHACRIGKHNAITGNVQIAGRVTMGDYCWVGTSSTISNGVTIGDHAQILIGSVVINDVKDHEVVSGNFAYAHQRHLKNHIKAKR